jgi:alpha-tubulin suppressor-like RCC1 family protein
MPRTFGLRGAPRFALAFLIGAIIFGLVAPRSATAQTGSVLPTVDLSEELMGVVALASLNGYNIAARDDGTVWEWRTYRQPPPNGAAWTHGAPAQIEGLREVIAVAAGDGYRLALRADGTVWSWGQNSSGQLGDGTRQRREAPAPVLDLHDIVAVAAGNAHSLALDANGTVYFWGQAAFGAPFDTLPWAQTAPAPVPGLPAMVAIAARDRYGLAIDTEGGVWTWDRGPMDSEDTWIAGAINPTRLAGLDDVVAVAAGSLQHLAVRRDGTVWAWTSYARSVPAPVDGLADVVAVSIGARHQSALTTEGTVWSWGPRWSCSDPRALSGRTDLMQEITPSGIVALVAGDCYTLASNGRGELASLPVTEPGSSPIAVDATTP